MHVSGTEWQDTCGGKIRVVVVLHGGIAVGNVTAQRPPCEGA